MDDLWAFRSKALSLSLSESETEPVRQLAEIVFRLCERCEALTKSVEEIRQTLQAKKPTAT
jgi:hypothetical protein